MNILDHVELYSENERAHTHVSRHKTKKTLTQKELSIRRERLAHPFVRTPSTGTCLGTARFVDNCSTTSSCWTIPRRRRPIVLLALNLTWPGSTAAGGMTILVGQKFAFFSVSAPRLSRVFGDDYPMSGHSYIRLLVYRCRSILPHVS